MGAFEAALLVVILGVGPSPTASARSADACNRPVPALRGLSKWVNGPLQVIAGVLPGIVAKAALVVRKAQAK